MYKASTFAFGYNPCETVDEGRRGRTGDRPVGRRGYLRRDANAAQDACGIACHNGKGGHILQ